MTKLLEWLRITLVILAFFMIHLKPPSQGLFWLVALMVLPLTGLTAVESLFFAKEAALAKKWDKGSPYQIQSGLNNLAVALTAIIVLAFNLNQQAQVTICLVALIFFALSSLNHIRAYFIDKSVGIHLQRFILTIFLWVSSAPILYSAMKIH
jgi:hypothetical protein